MADDEQFSLCWNNFNSNLSAGFHESLCRGDLVDVTLAAEGQFIKAHRLVLSVCSPYFRKMFTQMPTNQHAFVFLKDVSHSALKDLIQFMYCGEVNVKQDALPAFISTAEALQIKGLTDGDPAPSQSPAKPSTPAPQQIPAQAQQTVTTSLPRPKARTRTQAQTQQYKIETDDSDVEKATQIVIQTSTAPLTTSTPQTIQVQVQTTQQQQQTQTQQQTQQHQTQTVQIQPQTVVSAQKRVAQKSITPHTVKRTKLVQQPDPLEASEPTQITVQTVTESKTNNETEFIDLPIELPTKSEPEYAEDAGGDVETVEQEATYVEDDSYGDMKYDESYFTENDETGANVGGSGTGTAVQATTSTIKQQQPSFSESYVSDAGDQSATEAQEIKITVGSKILIPSNSIGNILQYTTTQRGRTMLIYDGYRYVENRQSQKNIFWRCSRYVRYGCRATVVTSKEGDSITIRIAGQPHTHDKELKCDTLLNDDKDLFTITNDRGTLYL
ncbi:modifier of mdg4 isoform X12 [Condylostylus longicornis]|uniref:modifier of mdg4 isoform X12 n=1 Tax=Condylostylus longicornis TaxID=2530218 RepID=UPI00244DB957|nr:modifier of mdg4 isoform X12 [Condylostylus longicornis]XP_055385184.1 modifier of mdg4 isoform X12 [Condylostylus longicornis]XP_055385185.1 modifier of mdg4 isoform X12 [Condylostylus longicornis]